MYMNPYTVSGIPDVIVMKTDEHTGKFLVYWFSIKGEMVYVAFRIPCGFQPCNVAELMGIKPVPTPTPAPTPAPPAPTPTPAPPTPTPHPTKDPTAGTDVGKNDDPGPGPDTNTGVGSQLSSEDSGTHTGPGYDSYDDYRHDMEELETVNEEQRVGGDPNTPTVTPAPGTTLYDQSDVGVGYGNIDTPTGVQQPVHILVDSNGQAQPISENPAGQWGGPPD